MSAVVKKAWSGTVIDEEQPKPPYRVGVALALVSFLWIGPYVGVQGVLLPSKVAMIAPSSKESIIAVLSTSAMIVAALANIVFGALSDLTRSRWGRRTPWIVFGSIACAVMLIVVNMANTVALLVLAWCVYQLFLNAIVAPSIAILSDMTAPKNRGVITSIYALGYSVGLYGGQIIGAQFLDKATAGFIVMALLTLVAGPVGAIGMRERSSLDMPRSKFDMHMVVNHFSFPVRHARDYYLALCGKFLIVAANFAISGYQLYILTDYMKQDSSQTSRLVSMISLCLMVTAIVMSAVAGPVADRIQRRRLPVVIASLFIAVGAFIPFLDNRPWTMIAYGVIGGIGMGTYNAVDQALNIEVLPNPDSAAKDLGILNLANTGGQVLGPVLSATLISAFGYHAIFPAATVCALGGAILVGLIKSVK